MTYLDLARSALLDREKSEQRLLVQAQGQSERASDCEISEQSEKRVGPNGATLLLAADEAEALKSRIIAAVTAEPAVFDRARYETLTARWEAHERALATHEAAVGSG